MKKTLLLSAILIATFGIPVSAQEKTIFSNINLSYNQLPNKWQKSTSNSNSQIIEKKDSIIEILFSHSHFGNSILQLFDLSEIKSLQQRAIDPEQPQVKKLIVAKSNANNVIIVIRSKFSNNYTQSSNVLSDKLYETFNRGNAWFNRTPPQLAHLNITDVDIDQNNTSRIWLVYNNFENENIQDNTKIPKILHSKANGLEWVDISQGLPPVNVNKLIYLQGSRNIIFVATEAGVFVWNDTMQKWESFNNGLPSGNADNIEMNYQSLTLSVSVSGEGVYTISL